MYTCFIEVFALKFSSGEFFSKSIKIAELNGLPWPREHHPFQYSDFNSKQLYIYNKTWYYWKNTSIEINKKTWYYKLHLPNSIIYIGVLNEYFIDIYFIL